MPIEFKMNPDGHRPVSEKYRILSDKEIQKAFSDIGLTPNLVTGSQYERLKKIIELYDLPIVVPINEAISKANDIITSNRESVSKKIIEQYKESDFKEKIKIMTNY